VKTASISIEDYLGAIYRLQQSAETLLPVSELQEFFEFSPISIHEMVQKLESLGLAEYQPYRGVKLTEKGSESAQSLVRRHRIWEVFLADELHVPMGEAHQLAGDLEHAAPDWITERLFEHLGEPDFCPHGSKIGDLAAPSSEIRLEGFLVGQPMVVTKIYPEKKIVLEQASNLGLIPGKRITLLIKNENESRVLLENKEEILTGDILNCIWGSKENHAE